LLCIDPALLILPVTLKSSWILDDRVRTIQVTHTQIHRLLAVYRPRSSDFACHEFVTESS